MFFLHLFLFLIVYSINRYYDKKEEEERKELHKLCDEILRDNNRTRHKKNDIEKEGELFFSDATDLDDDFK